MEQLTSRPIPCMSLCHFLEIWEFLRIISAMLRRGSAPTSRDIGTDIVPCGNDLQLAGSRNLAFAGFRSDLEAKFLARRTAE